MRILVLILVLIFQAKYGFTQINKQLKDISSKVSYSDKNRTESATQSKSVNIHIDEEDNLIIKEITSTLIESMDPMKRYQHLRIPISSIEDLYVSTHQIGSMSCDTCPKTDMSALVIKPLRNEALFEEIDEDNNVSMTSSAIFGITEFQPIEEFNRLTELIKNQYNLSKNHIEASCKVDTFQLSSNETEYRAIRSNNLSDPMQVNGTDLKTGIDKSILPLLEEMGLNAISFYIILNPDNSIEKIYVMEYEATKEPKLGFDKMPAEQQKQMISMLGLIDKAQNDKIVNTLTSMKWKAGKCKKNPVKCYYSYEYVKQHKRN